VVQAVVKHFTNATNVTDHRPFERLVDALLEVLDVFLVHLVMILPDQLALPSSNQRIFSNCSADSCPLVSFAMRASCSFTGKLNSYALSSSSSNTHLANNVRLAYGALN
jgi:hypothetical protein